MLCLLIIKTVLMVLIASVSHIESSTGAVSSNALTEDPEFTDTIENITVPAGRNVRLACSVKNLGSYKVAWMHFEQSAILTVHNHVITRNPRISVTHDKHDKHKTWFLHIANVQEEDKGRYMCQINTVTAKTQFGYLHVVVPPNIIDDMTSSDILVKEGSNVTLKCQANGSPQPTIRWKRDDNGKISINKTCSVVEWENEALHLTKVSRLDMSAYLCIASNGIPPSVSKRIKLNIDFPPMLYIPQQLVGIPVKFNVSLECVIESFPVPLTFWVRENDQNMIHDSSKHKTEIISSTPSYKSVMRLNIFNVQQSDYGIYKCHAKNSRGEIESSIRLYSSSPPSTIPPVTESVAIELTTPKIVNFPTLGQTTMFSNHMVDSGTKYQASSINEIENKLEQKYPDSAKSFDWSSEENNVNEGNQIMVRSILAQLLIVSYSLKIVFYCH